MVEKSVRRIFSKLILTVILCGTIGVEAAPQSKVKSSKVKSSQPVTRPPKGDSSRTEKKLKGTKVKLRHVDVHPANKLNSKKTKPNKSK